MVDSSCDSMMTHEMHNILQSLTFSILSYALSNIIPTILSSLSRCPQTITIVYYFSFDGDYNSLYYNNLKKSPSSILVYIFS